MFLFVNGLSRDICNHVFGSDVVQFDKLFIDAVSYHVVMKVNVPGYCVSIEIVGHGHDSLVAHACMHGEANMHTLAKEALVIVL